ncbi:pilus assembly protein TadG-related protein [Mesorhizobium sp. KR2-14]|uniref:pilus assembly protein TadG-related protein n=1 Tax=Mesorhizobium sp. KR2-14 TaxID=3156610 RepID=UPI0032B42009
MLRTLQAFWRDQSGIALILVAIMLPVIIGFSLLVIDMSRANTLHNDLQKAADAFALAAAAELDGQSDSIVRAERALITLVQNQYNFSGDSGPQILARAGIDRRFLSSLPPTVNGVDGDARPITASYQIANELTDAKLARYVEVTVRPVGFQTIFPASFLTGNAASNSFNVGATAVAGFKSGVCDYTPVFICNPYEDTSVTGGVTLEQAANTREYRRRQILLRNDKFYGPGNFAFLASPFGNGADELKDMLAKVKPLGCYSRDGVDTEPGQNTGPVEDGLNARFGISHKYMNTPDGPAANVRMGLKSISCNGNPKPEFHPIQTDQQKEMGVGLERDPCQYVGSCPYMDGRMGRGDWNFDRYWRANHTVPATTGQPRPHPFPTSGPNMPTRYEIYRYELDPDGNPLTNDSIVGDASKGGEKGTPACGQTPVTTVDRRILYGAILDCKALAAAGYSLSGRQKDVPVRAFGSFFITEPIKDDKEIYVELVDITGKGGRGTLDNFLRDEAQLYR